MPDNLGSTCIRGNIILRGTIFTLTLSQCRPLEFEAVSKVMLTSKVSPWRDLLADAAAYPRDVVH